MAKFKGNDDDNIIIATLAQDVVIAKGGDDFVFGASGDDVIKAGGGDDEVNGGSGNDKIVGGAGIDILVGGSGDDTLKGALDDDILVGGEGRDIVDGGGGTDIMTGGEGEDVFRFAPGFNTPWGVGNADIITDFEQVAGPGGDVLRLPAGSLVTFSFMFEDNGVSSWFLQYGGGANSGFMILTSLAVEPDYEFV